jgi:hypothetical protein
MRTFAEDESDAAKPRDYSLVGTWVELFKYHISEERGVQSITYRSFIGSIDASVRDHVPVAGFN